MHGAQHSSTSWLKTSSLVLNSLRRLGPRDLQLQGEKEVADVELKTWANTVEDTKSRDMCVLWK